ncbi:MAG: transporter ATP-binding protein [Parcubacteria group bacterium]|nr:transporter ATP-binding protein [Parcubacteria group bacterium]
MKFGKALTQESTIFLIRKLWQFSKGRHWQIVLYTGMFVVANLITLLPPLIFGAFIREVQQQGIATENYGYLFLLLFFLFFIEIVFWAFHGPARIIERSVAFWAELNYRRYLLKGVLDLGLTWHGEHDSGDTIDKVNKAGDGLGSFGKNVFQILQIVIKLLGTSIVLFYFSPAIGIFVFVLVVVSFIVIFQFDRYLIPQYRRLNEFSNKAMASIFDALSNITSVKILHIEMPVLKGIVSRLEAPYTKYQANSKLNEAKWFTGGILFQAIAVLPIVFYIYHASSSNQPIDAGTISTLFLYLTNLTFVYFGFTDFYQDLAIYKNQVLNVESVEDAFAAKNILKRKSTSAWGTLTISDLTFTYDEGGEVPHLYKVGLQIQRGERIAVIGESGSGKTTFLKVLHGLYPSAQGTLTLDRSESIPTSFADLDLKTMLVPQEPEIFSSTIRENITLGIAYPEEDIVHAMRVANFEKVVQELPSGLDSVINEKGVSLSGGQKQRLALSRALLFARDKEMILLDESTSSVDSENETEIYTNIWQDFVGKTVIASIHKMNLLKLFDRIYIFEKGQIVDAGSFDDLLNRSASFKDAWDQFVAMRREK